MRVLYIDIDSLRPDHLGCYGYHRPLSPAIDAIAAQGARFSHCYASDTPCVPSRAACFSGRMGIQNGVVAHEHIPSASQLRYGNAQRGGGAPVWMHQLARNDVHTASFSSFANRHLMGWFHFGFREFHLDSLKNGDEDAPEVNAVFLPWLEHNANRDDWFVHLNFWDPHTYYTQPRQWFDFAAQFPAPDWPDAETIERQQRDTGVRSASHIWTQAEEKVRARWPNMPAGLKNRADFEHLINGYDGAIAFLDSQLKLVFDALKQQGVWDETAIIISADHGEAFGELGQYMEHGSASPTVHHIPLIIKWPGVTQAGTVCDDLVLNIDLSCTVSDALSLGVPTGWNGRSLLPALRGEKMPQQRERIVLSHGLHTRQRTVFDGRYAFIRTYEPSYYEYQPRMLFDLHNDPHQTEDISLQHPEASREMETYLLNWEREQLNSTGLPDPMREITDIPVNVLGGVTRHLEQLRSEGRADDAARLEAIRARVASEYAPAPL
ncbi:MAG: sulfatase-like hydrolase/transferase [Armatimonadetes bacterium]|nr:sulfatase-like hydrolase/transferase [Armatimonadota bacterium]